MTKKQYKIEFDGYRYFHVVDIVNERCLARLDTMPDARAWLEVYEMLSDENEQLKRELDEFKQPNCKKCMYYSVDSASDYCMCENGLLDRAWEMFPFEWDYTNAKNCKEYEE